MTATTPVPSDHARLAYDRLAPIYDAFTAHHDHELWIGNLLEPLRRLGLSETGTLLDLACGTGKSFVPMLARDWRVTGVDASPAMLARARIKSGDAPVLSCGDLRALPSFGSFDLVWSLSDAMNYLLSADELVAGLAGFRRNLKSTGLGLFDVDTLASYRGFFADTETVKHNGGRLVWIGRTDPDCGPGVHAVAEVEIQDEKGRTVDTAVHHQRHYGAEEITAAVNEAGLELVEYYGHTHSAVLEQPLDESRHTKAIYIVRIKEGR